MILKKAEIFPEGSCIGHYDGKRIECKTLCKISKECKKICSSGNANEVKKIMKVDDKTVTDCLRGVRK